MDAAYIFAKDHDGAADAPVAGLYQWVRTGRPPQPVAIGYGSPIDPDTPAPIDPRTAPRLDRSPRWQMLVSGRLVAFFEDEKQDVYDPLWDDVWPYCRDHKIGWEEYLYLVAAIDHAQRFDPDSPFARPGRRINLDTASMPQ